MLPFKIGDKTFESRLFLGTGKFGSNPQMEEAILASGSELVTRGTETRRFGNRNRCHFDSSTTSTNQFIAQYFRCTKCQEAVFAAQLAREALETNWLKLEIHPDPKYLMPDPIETLKATEELAKLGFIVLPYIHADPVLCKRLEDAGTSAVMPLGSPIGSNKGLKTIDFLEIIIEQSKVPVIIDAGIGAPSDAAKAMEMGADAVLVNTAIAVAGNPKLMAEAFKEAVIAGRKAYEAQLAQKINQAVASSPLTAFLYE